MAERIADMIERGDERVEGMRAMFERWD